MADRIEVLLVQPGKYPKKVVVENTLESLQSVVDGDIEVVYPFEDAVAVICNENGKLEGLEPNRAVRDEDGHIYDILVGIFLVVGLCESEFSSLPSELLEKYEKIYHTPEFFVRVNDKIAAYPMPEWMMDDD